MLAEANEPLVLADGTRIDPSGKVIREKKYNKYIEVPSGTQAQAIIAKSRRAIAELPLPPAQLNTVSLVLFYSMWGLGDPDIALATNLSIPQIKNIRKLDEYVKISEDIKKSVLEFEANDIRAKLQAASQDAVNKVIDTMEEDGALGFAAAKDILDRTGNRPADVVEHRHRMEDSLKIEFIVKKPVEDDIPLLNITDYKDTT